MRGIADVAAMSLQALTDAVVLRVERAAGGTPESVTALSNHPEPVCRRCKCFPTSPGNSSALLPAPSHWRAR
jgi:hypothetical protein